jgi:hypothetical protein
LPKKNPVPHKHPASASDNGASQDRCAPATVRVASLDIRSPPLLTPSSYFAFKCFSPGLVHFANS